MEKATELNLTAADISAALLFTASKDARQACNALHLFATGHAVVTDGHTMLIRHLCLPPVADLSLSFDALKPFAKSGCLVCIHLDSVILSGGGLTASVPLVSPHVPWRKVIPALDEARKHVHCRPTYLTRFEKIGKLYKAGESYTHPAIDALLVEYSDNEHLVGVVMGIRRGIDVPPFAVPGWLDATA